MEESIKDKIKVLQTGAANQEEFMKQLADVDENGQLTDDMLDAVNGGVGFVKGIDELMGGAISLPDLK